MMFGVRQTSCMTTSTGEERDVEPAARRQAIPYDTFGARLRLSRLHAGDLTIKEAAEKCGLNYGSWSNWERGSRPLDFVETVDAISNGLGIDRDWLMFGGPLAREKPRRRRGREVNVPDTLVYPITGVIGPISRKRPTNPRPPGHPGGIRHPDGFVRPARTSKPIAA